MSHHDDEISELIEYISGLRRTFNRKLDDHLFIIEQQRERIDFQQHLIDDQRAVVDELAWQIRDLRDSVRQCCEKVTEFEGNQCTKGSSSEMDRSAVSTNCRARIVRQEHVFYGKLKKLFVLFGDSSGANLFKRKRDIFNCKINGWCLRN